MRFIYSKTFASFFFALCVVVLFVFMSVRGWLSPVRSVFLQIPRPVVAVVRWVGGPVRGFFSTIYGLRGLVQENGQLSARIFTLEKQLVQFDELKRENDALRSELNFKQTTTDEYEPCSVLSENPVGLTGTAVINCGTNQGVSEGAAAVSEGYLIGKVVYVSKNSATVLLATDSKFSADARISKTGANGIVRGSFGSGLVLDQLSQSEPTDKGDMVVTAGINEKIPKNILIGHIGDVLSGPNDLFKKTTLVSPVDFTNLQFVFVAQ